jgi:hypothetical protein
MAKMFARCRKVELIWGRGGAFVDRAKPVAEGNYIMELRVETSEGEALRARGDWVRLDLEKVKEQWVVRKARWHAGGGKGLYSPFAMPELP